MRTTRQALIAEVGRALQAYQRSTQSFDDEVGRVLGVNPTDLRCLDWLSEGPMTATRLAEATGLSAAATTDDRPPRAQGLRSRRRRNDGDRRQVLVELTEEAAEAGSARSTDRWSPRVADAGRLLPAELIVMRDQLVAMRADRPHRARLRWVERRAGAE